MPHHGWLPPLSPPPEYWPSEPPAGLGGWGKQTEHRLRTLETQAALDAHLVQEITELRERVQILENARGEAAAPPEQERKSVVAGLLSSQTARWVAAVIIAVGSSLATGKVPDLWGK